MANGYMHLAVQERALIETQLRLGMSPGGGWPRLLTLVATTKRVGGWIQGASATFPNRR